jgi:DNA-binding winged helix-turn-helix (wHTH) protein
VALSRAEIELLQELARNPRHTLSREELRRAIVRRRPVHFDQSIESFDRSVDMLVARLRRKIEPDPKVPRFLVTVPGVGYKLMAQPEDHPGAGKLEVHRSEPERRQITALSCNLVGAIAFAIGCDPEDLNRTKLKSTRSQVGETSPEDIYLYARLLSIPTPAPESLLNLTPRREKDLALAALVRHLQAVAQRQALIIVLADAHWIDISTLQLVNKIIPLIKTAQIFLLIKFRPEFNPQWLGEPHVTMLRLERLSRDPSLAIVSEHTGGKRLPPELNTRRGTSIVRP